MGGLFTQLFSKISSVLGWFAALAVAIFEAMYLMLKDVFSWIFDSVLSVAVTAISAIDTSSITPYINSAGSLPGQLLNILGLLGVGQAITIISAAIVIRLGLQLIPFTRLGS